MEIPAGPEALTPEWLTQAVRARGAIQDASVTAFEVKPMDQGGLGQIARLSLAYMVYTVTHFARSEEGRQWWIDTALPRSYAAILDVGAGEALPE